MATTSVKFVGVDRFIKKLEKHRVKINRVTKTGLREAAELVKQKTLAITPEEYGDLKESIKGGKDGLVIKSATGMYTEVGWKSHPYALAVHESPGVLKGKPRPSGIGNYWDVTGEPKFLEKAVFKNWRKIKKLIVKKRKL